MLILKCKTWRCSSSGRSLAPHSCRIVEPTTAYRPLVSGGGEKSDVCDAYKSISSYAARLARNRGRSSRFQCAANVCPACVRISPGKEEECSLKPFNVTQRVRRPPGKGGARQPEASLAWVTATSLVKRRQRVLKPCDQPRNHGRAEAFAVLDPGAALGKPLWPG